MDNYPQEGIMGDILKYLEQQQIIGGEDAIDADYGLKRARSVLSEILRKIDNRAKLIDAFEAAVRAHNQYPLFDLENIIPEFLIDDDLYDKMTFRESLLVSVFSKVDDLSVPTPCGGLCLDVQKAKGRGPLVRRDPNFEQQLIELLTWKHEEGNTKDKGTWTEACKTCHDNISQSTHKSHKRKKCPQSASDTNSEESAKIEPTISQLKLLEHELGIGNSLKRTQCKFLVHQSSQFYLNDLNAGSIATSWVDKNLHTLEEKRTEFLVEKDGTVKEKTLFVAMQKGKYYVKTRSTVDDCIEKKFYSFRKAKNYVSEGANSILMRFLALTGYVGEFELATMYINGNMCRNIYKCTGPEKGISNDKKIDLFKIYRTIIEECGVTHNSVTVLSKNGQIIKQEWQDCDYILQINPFAEIKEEKPGKLERIYLKHVWENDMEIFSRYLDKKEKHHLKLKQYLKDHQEVHNIISDYLGRILLMKPEKVIEFTIEHFSQYVPFEIPKEYYFTGLEDEETIRFRDSEESFGFSMSLEEYDDQDAHVNAINYMMSMSDGSCVCEGVCLCDEDTSEKETSDSCICSLECLCEGDEEETEVKILKQIEESEWKHEKTEEQEVNNKRESVREETEVEDKRESAKE